MQRCTECEKQLKDIIRKITHQYSDVFKRYPDVFKRLADREMIKIMNWSYFT